MKRYVVLVICLILSGVQVVSADWNDRFNTYTNDAEIQAVYGSGGVFRSAYIHTNRSDTWSWNSARVALGVQNNNDYAVRALNRSTGSKGVSATAWFCPFTYENTTGHLYAVDIRVCSDSDIDNYQAMLQVTNGRFRVLDYDTINYLDIDLDGDGDVDGDDVLKKNYYYKIRIDAIPNTINGGTYDVYINDILVYTNARYRSSLSTNDTTYLAFAQSGASGGPTIVIDDVTVRSIMSSGWTEDFSMYTNTQGMVFYWSGNYMGYSKIPYVSSYGHGGTTNSSYISGDNALGITHDGTFAVQPLYELERPATVEFWVNTAIYGGVYAGGTGHVYLCSSEIGTPGGVDNTNCWQARLDFTSGKKMKVYDGADDAMHEVSSIDMVERTYYKIKIVAFADVTGGGFYNVYLNDTQVYRNAKFKPAYAHETPVFIKLTYDYMSGYKAPFAFDDFVITDSPAMGTVIMIK
jgi:hypothetical protein